MMVMVNKNGEESYLGKVYPVFILNMIAFMWLLWTLFGTSATNELINPSSRANSKRQHMFLER